MLDLRAAANAAERETVTRSKTPLAAAKRRSANGTATRADVAELDRNESLRAGAIARQREAARSIVATVDALIASGTTVDPQRVYLMGPDHLDRDGNQLDAREVIAAAADSAAKRGRKGIESPVSGRFTLPQWRSMMLRIAGPLNRRAAESGAKLTDDERADLVSAMTADVIAGCLTDPELIIRKRVRGPITAEQSRRADALRPGIGSLLPAPADLPSDLDVQGYNAARRWHRSRIATIAAQAPAEAGENVPDDSAADTLHAISEGLHAVAAAERAAERVGLTLTAAQRWTLRTGFSGMTSPVLAALYGVAESSVRVGDMRGAASLVTLPPDVLSRWGRGTGRILSALCSPLPDEHSIVSAMRANVARNRDARMTWPDRVPKIKRDRESHRLVYTDAPDCPKGAGTRVAPWPIYGCQTPARVRAAGYAPLRPYAGFCALSVPVSDLDLTDPRPIPVRTLAPWSGPSRPVLDIDAVLAERDDDRRAALLTAHSAALSAAGFDR